MSELLLSTEPNFLEDQVHVRIGSAQENVSLSFFFLGEMHNMQRSYDESLFKTITRLARTCLSKLEKKHKTKKAKPEKTHHQHHQEPPHHEHHQPKDELSDLCIMKNLEKITIDEMITGQLESGMVIYVNHKLNFNVVVNAPSIIQHLTYPRSFYSVNCPIVPTVTLEFANDFNCLWYRETEPKSNDYIFVSSEKIFTPDEQCLDCRLKLFCTAIRKESQDVIIQGRSYVFYLGNHVRALPENKVINGMCTLKEESNYQLTKESKENLRVMTYNVLSEGYCLQDRSVDIFYHYCLRDHLETEYRMQLVAHELIQSNADIIALQECDKKVFDLYFLPLLGSMGYSGHFTNKNSGVVEGCALFVRRDELQVIQYYDLPYKKILGTHPALNELYQVRPDLQDIIGGKLGTVGQIAVCQRVRGNQELVILGNTHLFYHPLASYIRLLQSRTLVHFIQNIQQQLQSFLEGKTTNWNQSFASFQAEDMILKQELEKTNLLLPLTSVIRQESTYATMNTSEQSQPLRIGVIVLGDLNCTPNTPSLVFLEK